MFELLRDQAHGFGEGDVFDFLDEAEDVAGHAAAEAVIKLARGMDGKRRRLFAVKRAKPGEVLRPGLLQLDVVADDADDVRLLLDRVREVAGVRHEWETLLRRNCELESGWMEYIGEGLLWRSCGIRGYSVEGLGKAGLIPLSC